MALACGFAITLTLTGCVGGANDKPDVFYSANIPTVAVVATVAPGGADRPGLDESLWAYYGQPLARPTEYATIEPVAEPEPDLQLRLPRLSAPDVAPAARTDLGGDASDWRRLLEQYGDWDVDVMLRIIYGPWPCPNGESGGNASAVNPSGRDWGGLQIDVSNYQGDPYDLLDPATNVRVGHAVYLAQGYGAWSCF